MTEKELSTQQYAGSLQEAPIKHLANTQQARSKHAASTDQAGSRRTNMLEMLKKCVLRKLPKLRFCIKVHFIDVLNYARLVFQQPCC